MSGKELTTSELLVKAAARIVLHDQSEDYLAFAVVSHGLGGDESARVLRGFDKACPMPGGESAYEILLQRLSLCEPVDHATVTDQRMMEVSAGWGYWCDVQQTCTEMGQHIFVKHHPLECLRNDIEVRFSNAVKDLRKWTRDRRQER